MHYYNGNPSKLPARFASTLIPQKCVFFNDPGIYPVRKKHNFPTNFHMSTMKTLHENSPPRLCGSSLPVMSRTGDTWQLQQRWTMTTSSTATPTRTTTPPKTNMTMEKKQPFEDVSPIKVVIFHYHASFLGVYCYTETGQLENLVLLWKWIQKYYGQSDISK